MRFIGIIPARYNSTRFPGKPLAMIRGKTMIQRVYEQTTKVLPEVYVATDDQRIEQNVNNFNGNVVMTGSGHRSGTDRIREASGIISRHTAKSYDVIVNIQGDEPFIQPEQIRELTNCFNDENTEIATLIKRIDKKEALFNPNLPKVITDQYNYAIYFSRTPIPYVRNKETSEWLNSYSFHKHIGIYAYKSGILNEITSLEPSSLELAEALEQNRWIENGYKIKTAITKYENYPIDTPEDLENTVNMLFPE
ncbi:MAG: 3-deoxy-manno-octulosonate cytidylyltransferase [Bacteroidales bacterium]|nr:3-deoxy-manno-octulosonate cytidylyltransferase [Bacteroidales bacterium]